MSQVLFVLRHSRCTDKRIIPPVEEMRRFVERESIEYQRNMDCSSTRICFPNLDYLLTPFYIQMQTNQKKRLTIAYFNISPSTSQINSHDSMSETEFNNFEYQYFCARVMMNFLMVEKLNFSIFPFRLNTKLAFSILSQQVFLLG